MGIQLSWAHLLKRLSFPQWIVLSSYTKSIDCKRDDLFLGFQVYPLHLYVCPFTSTTLSDYYNFVASFEIRDVSPPTSFFFTFWPHLAACGNLSSRPGIKPTPTLWWKWQVLTTGLPVKSPKFVFLTKISDFRSLYFYMKIRINLSISAKKTTLIWQGLCCICRSVWE